MRFATAKDVAGWRVAVFVARATDDCGYLYSFHATRNVRQTSGLVRKVSLGGEGWTAGARRDAIEQALSDAREGISKRSERAVA